MVPSYIDLKVLTMIAEEFGLTELAKDIMEKDIPTFGDWIELAAILLEQKVSWPEYLIPFMMITVLLSNGVYLISCNPII